MTWYRVLDREPPKDTPIITYGTRLETGEKDVDGCIMWNGADWYSDQGIIWPRYYKVTHWAEMPEPPAE